MDVQILDGIFGSIQYPNFFNGRVLTATDLQNEREADITRSRYLGQGLGSGVVYGLNVVEKKEDTNGYIRLDISSGLAINRLGEALHLAKDEVVELKPSKPSDSSEASIFGACNGKTPSAELGGFYLLAITPSDPQTSEKRTRIGTGSVGGQVGCTHQYEEVGIQFKLIHLKDVLRDAVFNPKADRTHHLKFRNRLAMMCFGIGEWKAYLSDAFINSQGTNLIEVLRKWDKDRAPLGNSDVPLAVMHIEANKIDFLDMWAVRRPCMPGMGLDAPAIVPRTDQVNAEKSGLMDLAMFVTNPQKSIEAAAFLFQFQHHLQDLVTETGLAVPDGGEIPIIKNYFEYIPAAGVVPAHAGLFPSIIAKNFFGSMAIESPSPLDRQTVRYLFNRSFYEEPIKCDVEIVDIIDARPDFVFVRHHLKGQPIIVQIIPGSGIQGKVVQAMVFGHYLAHVKSIHFTEISVPSGSEMVSGNSTTDEPDTSPADSTNRPIGPDTSGEVLGNRPIEPDTSPTASTNRPIEPDVSGEVSVEVLTGESHKISADVLPGGTDGWVPVMLKIGSDVSTGRYTFQLETTSDQIIESTSSDYPIEFEVLPKTALIAITAITPSSGRRDTTETINIGVRGLDGEYVIDTVTFGIEGVEGITAKNTTIVTSRSNGDSIVRVEIAIGRNAEPGPHSFSLQGTIGGVRWKIKSGNVAFFVNPQPVINEITTSIKFEMELVPGEGIDLQQIPMAVGYLGSSVDAVIRGKGLADVKGVFFPGIGVSATVQGTTDEAVLVTIDIAEDASTGDHFFWLATPQGIVSSLEREVTLDVMSRPIIMGITKDYINVTQGVPHESVDCKINGRSLSNAYSVLFSGYGISAEVDEEKSTDEEVSIRINFEEFVAFGDHSFQITTPQGTVYSPKDIFFSVRPQPIITAITPTFGYVGDTVNVVIEGSGLAEAIGVIFTDSDILATIQKASEKALIVAFKVAENTAFGQYNFQIITSQGKVDSNGFLFSVLPEIEMVYIPAGAFKMGSSSFSYPNSERPAHNVTISSFLMGKYPVTQTQWRAVATLTKIDQELDLYFPQFENEEDFPAQNINWSQAVEFCARLSKATGRQYRLPSEAEWEYACRARTTTAFYFGDDENQLESYAWYTANSDNKTHPVGDLKPNTLGLYDMHGNVLEWCQDVWHDDYIGAPDDGKAWLDSGSPTGRVLRGGSYIHSADYCRSACRFHNLLTSQNSAYGFRVVCSV
jgi:formylglycine-generating enzyme required for sulfatase activity